MLVAFILYLSHFFYFTGRFEIYGYMDSIYILASLSVFPLYHIYVRLLTTDREFSLSSHFRYLALPAAIFLLHVSGYIIMDRSEIMHYLTEVLPGREPGRGVAIYVKYIHIIYRIAFVTQVIFYLFLNYKLIREHNQKLLEFYSNTEERELNWVQFFNFSLSLTSLASVFALFAGREVFIESVLYLAFPSLIFSILLFFIGLLGNRQRESEDGNMIFQEIPSGVDESGSSGSSEDEPSKDLIRKMEELFEKEMIFRNSDLKIWDLCNMLGTNRTYVSRVINRKYGRNFCNHVNYYRVEYAKKLISENRNFTNEEVAESSGFGSVNTLYRAFSSFENKTLGDFRKLSG